MTSDTTGLPRPWSGFGLFASLFGILLLSVLVLAAGLAIFGLADFALFGRAHLVGLVRSAQQLPVSGKAGAAELAGFIAGSIIYLALIAGILILARLRGGAGWPLLVAWTPFRTDSRYWNLLAAGIVYSVAASALIGYLHPVSRTWFTLPKSPAAVIVSFLLIAVLAPLAEELLFRGWLYTGLRSRYSFAVALSITSLVFSLDHWERTLLYATAVLPIGVVLGYLRERTGSVRATALFHGLYNLSGWLLTFLGMA